MTETDLDRTSGVARDVPPDRPTMRSEERLVISTEAVPVARVRLRKYLVTEEQTFTVPVTREEIEIDYADIPPGEQGPDGVGPLAPAEVEVIRYEERVVVTKQVVAVERVRLVRRVVTVDQVVTGQVRREVVEVDDVATLDGARTGTP